MNVEKVEFRLSHLFNYMDTGAISCNKILGVRQLLKIWARPVVLERILEANYEVLSAVSFDPPLPGYPRTEHAIRESTWELDSSDVKEAPRTVNLFPHFSGAAFIFNFV